MQQRLAAVGEMAAGIAHEISNPLASMSGSMQMLRQELALTGDQAQLMDIVLKESDRLNHTIKSFLAYAKPQKAQLTRLDLADAGEGDGHAAAQQPGCRRAAHRGACRCPTARCPWKGTRASCGRSSGTLRPTACGRCAMAASCA